MGQPQLKDITGWRKLAWWDWPVELISEDLSLKVSGDIQGLEVAKD